MENRYYDRTVADVEREFDTSAASGLSAAEARRRLKRNGRKSVYIAFSDNKRRVLHDIMYGFSFFAMLISAILYAVFSPDRYLSVSAAVLLVLFFLAAAITYAKSDKVIRDSIIHGVSMVKVIRDGKHQVVRADCIVRGDLIILCEGDIAPADCVVVSGQIFVLDSEVTGYRYMHKKRALNEQLSISDANNMVFASSIVKSGECWAIVAGTGDECEISRGGRIEKGYRLDDLACLKTVDSVSSAVFAVSFGVSLVSIIMAFVYKFSTPSLIEAVFGSVILCSGILAQFSFVFVKAIIAARLHGMRKKGENDRCIITNPASMDRMSKTDLLLINADELFCDDEYEVVGFSCSGEVYDARETVDNPDAALFLRCLTVAEGVSSFNPHGKRGNSTPSGAYSQAITAFSTEKTGGSRFRLAYKRSASFDSPYDVSVLAGSERFGFIRSDFESILNRSDTVICGKRPRNLDNAYKSELRTVAGRFLAAGYELSAYARRIYTDEEIAANDFSIDSLQFYGMVAYKRKLSPDANSFFERCIEQHLRPVILAGKAKYMIRELKATCPSLEGTRFCTGPQLASGADVLSASETYDFFVDLSEKQKTELIRAFKATGYNVCLYTDKMYDFSLTSYADTLVTTLDDYEVCYESTESEDRHFNGEKIKCGAISESSDALSGGALCTVDLVNTSRRIYIQLETVVKYLVGVFMSRALVIFVMSLFGEAVFTPTQLLSVSLYSDLVGIICVALSCRRAGNASTKGFSMRLYRYVSSAACLPSYAFALTVILISVLSKYSLIGIDKALLSSVVFISFILLSPIALAASSRSMWTRVTVVYLFSGILLVLLCGSLPVLREALGILEYSSSALIALIPLSVYLITTIICYMRESSAEKIKGDI